MVMVLAVTPGPLTVPCTAGTLSGRVSDGMVEVLPTDGNEGEVGTVWAPAPGEPEAAWPDVALPHAPTARAAIPTRASWRQHLPLLLVTVSSSFRGSAPVP